MAETINIPRDSTLKELVDNVGKIAENIDIDSKMSKHNTDPEAHSDMRADISAASTTATEAAKSAEENASAIADSAKQIAQNSADIADNKEITSLLLKYPSYKCTTSGGSVQRFDDVGAIPHNIGVTVHGATNDSGNSVTNPTVNIFGKNLLSPNFVGSINLNIVDDNVTYEFLSGGGIKFTVSDTTTKETHIRYSRNNDSSTNDSALNKFPKGKYAAYNLNSKIYVYCSAKNLTTDNSFVIRIKNGYNYKEPFKINYYAFILEAGTEAGEYILYPQLECGDKVTEYEPYKAGQTATYTGTLSDGEAWHTDTLKAVSPNMTVIATDDNKLVSTVDIDYNADLLKRIETIEAAIAAQA